MVLWIAKFIRRRKSHVELKIKDKFRFFLKTKKKFKLFFKFGRNIKLGFNEASADILKIAKLLRYYSSHDGGEEHTTLNDYVSRMISGQNVIYFSLGKSVEEIKTSDAVKRMSERGFEVLYMCEPIDEYCVQQLREFDGKTLVSVINEETGKNKSSRKWKLKQDY